MNIQLKKNKFSGKLIVFEGCDGSGKTTLLTMLENYLKTKNIKCTKTKMPSERVRSVSCFVDYDNSLDNTIRETLNLEDLTIFVCGDRLITLNTDIIPYLKQGYVVLCDRYCYTGISRCNTKLIRKISTKFIKPDITFFVSCDPKTLKQRVKSRNNEKNNFYDDKTVLNQIKIFNRLQKSQKFELIDTNQSIQNSFSDILKKVDNII